MRRFVWFFPPVGLVSCLRLAEVDEPKEGSGGAGAVGPSRWYGIVAEDDAYIPELQPVY